MKDISLIINQVESLGATLIPWKDKIKVQAAEPLPQDIISEIKEFKQEILSELQRRMHLSNRCWILEEWRRISIPDWRHILIESIEINDHKREEYARWMLKEVLNDPDYKEPVK
jgi:hypothetical protein